MCVCVDVGVGVGVYLRAARLCCLCVVLPTWRINVFVNDEHRDGFFR